MRLSTRDPGAARRGFSLMEMVVVLAIVAIVAAMIVPTIGPMRRQGRLRVGAATVAGSLRLARSLAIAQSAPYSVDSPSSGQMRIYGGYGPFSSNPVVDTPLLPSGVLRESSSPAWVSFQPDGSCTGINISIRDESLSSDKRTIEAKAASGRIVVSGGSR